MTWALFGSKALAFLKQVPIWVWIIIVFALTLQWTKMSSYRKGKDDAQDEIKLKQAQVREAVTERKSEIIAEEIEHADAALDARDGVEHYPTYDSLPDDLKRIANRGKGGGAGS